MIYFILGGIAIIIVAIILVSLLFRVVVSTNEVHIIQTSKKSIPYGKGEAAGNVYYNFPAWFPFIGVSRIILPVSNFNVLINDYAAFDENKVPFLVDVASFFRINNPTEAAQKISSFAELKDQLRLILSGSIRSVFATKPIISIMEDREAISELFNQSVISQLSSWWVESVKAVEIMDIKDDYNSNVIKNIKDQKSSEIEKNSRIEIAMNQKEAEIAEIEAQKEASIIAENAKREIGQKEAERERLVGIAKEQSQQEIAAEAKITAEKELEVKQVEAVRMAEIAKKEAEIKAEQDKNVMATAAEAKKIEKVTNAEALKLEQEKKAEADLFTEAKNAEWDLVRMTKNAEGNYITMAKNAEGIHKEGEANAEATRLMEIAKVSWQIELAEKISEKPTYMEYLQMIEAIKASEKVGVSRSTALEKAEMKIMANSNNVDDGVNNMLELFSSKWGTSIGSMLENLNNTELGRELISKFMKSKKEEPLDSQNHERRIVRTKSPEATVEAKEETQEK